MARKRCTSELRENRGMTYVPAEERYDSMPYRRWGRSGLKPPGRSFGLW
jgi:hypothetical protein